MTSRAIIVCLSLAATTADLTQAQIRVAPGSRAQAIVEAVLDPVRFDSVPRCVAAVQSGQYLALASAGLASLEFAIPLSSSTSFHVGSIAKQFIATIAFLLDERGQLDLDAPVTSLIPELPPRFGVVRGRHLLSHTSGLRDHLQAAHHAGAGLHESPSRDETLALIARHSRLNFPPGSDVSYSNSNYFLLQIMIERAADQTIDEIAQRLIFDPLGMQSTRFLVDGLEVVPGRARGYREAGDEGYRLHEPTPGVGGLLTTLDDLLLWARHLRRMQEEDDSLLIKMISPAHLLDGRVTREAAGLRVDARFNRKVVEHNGSNRGFNSYFGWYPDEGVFVVVMCNLRQARATSIANKIAAAVFNAESPSRPSYPKLGTEAIELLAPFAGVYEPSTGDGVLELEIEAPYAIVTLYGSDPSESRTASHVLAPTDESVVFTLTGLSPDSRLSLEAAAPTPVLVFELPGTAAQHFRKVTPPDRTDLESLVGRFRSDDLNVVYALSIEETEENAVGLVIERPDGRLVDRGRLLPVTGDFYVIERDPVSNIRLERDSADRVIGFILSEPRLRGVAFVRLSDD